MSTPSTSSSGAAPAASLSPDRSSGAAPIAAEGLPGAAIGIQPMELGHLPEVMAIDALCYPVPWPQKTYKTELARPNTFYLVAVCQQAVIGHGGISFEGNEAHVTTVSVNPECGGQGVGTRIFLALAVAACRRSTSLILEVAADNHGAQALYRRFGLAPVGIRKGYYTEMGLPPDALTMQADNINCSDYAARLATIAAELNETAAPSTTSEPHGNHPG